MSGDIVINSLMKFPHVLSPPSSLSLKILTSRKDRATSETSFKIGGMM